MSTPTQTLHPWRATVRTAFAMIVALAAMLPLLVAASGVDETLGPVGGVLAIAGAITRIMALPAANEFLARFVPWLAAAPTVAALPSVAIRVDERAPRLDAYLAPRSEPQDDDRK